MRYYVAFWDDGHDFGEFEFCSSHKANSKANIEDAYREYHQRYGYSHKVKITSTQLMQN